MLSATASTRRAPELRTAGWMAPSLVVFLLALLVRAIYLVQLSHHSDLTIPLFDAQGYVARADQWIRGRGLAAEVLEFSLLYHVVLSAQFFITDASLGFARALQAVLSAFSCAGLAFGAARIFGSRAGWVTGVIAAFYGPALVLHVELMPTVWESFWCIAACAGALAGSRMRAGVWERVAWGVLGGLGFLLGPRYGLTWCALAWALRSDEAATSGAPRRWAAAGFALPLLMVFVLLGGRLIAPETLARGATNFHLGNSGELCKTLTMRPGPDFLIYMEKARRVAVAESMTLAQYFMRETGREISARPLRFFDGLRTKTLHLLSSREIPSAIDIRATRDAIPVVRPLLFSVGPVGVPFGPVLFLGVIGLVLHWRRVPRPFLILLLVPALWMIATRVSAADRLPWALLWLPLAGAGFSALWPDRGSERPRGWAFAVAAGAAAFGLAVQPGPFCVEAAQGRAEFLRAIGQYHLQRYETARAASYFGQALALDPNEVQAINGAGICHQLGGRADEARACFERAIALKPDYSFALFNLAGLEAAQGRLAAAAQYLERGLVLQPENGKARNELGALYLKLDQPAEAIPHFERAMQITPNVLDPCIGLAAAYSATGRADDAEKLLRSALKWAPLDARIHVMLGFTLMRRGDVGAEGHFLAARERDSKSPDPHYGLAIYYQRAGRMDDARAALAHALVRDPDRRLLSTLAREHPALPELLADPAGP